MAKYVKVQNEYNHVELVRVGSLRYQELVHRYEYLLDILRKSQEK